MFVVENADIKSGYAIQFTFGDNDYLAAGTLVKEFRVNSETSAVEVTVPEITWKEGKSLLEPLPASATDPSKVGEKRRRPADDEAGPEDDDEEEEDDDGRESAFFAWLASNSTECMELAELIKEEIWPNPLQYSQEEEGEDEGEFGEEEDFGEEDEDEDENEDEDEDEEDGE